MAMKPLTFYQQGAVAGMQQDQYSQAPWFVDSKNLDIFSSSQSVKATAWSEPELVDSNIVDVDHRGRFELHKNGKVRDREIDDYITNHDKFDNLKNIYKNTDDATTSPMIFGIPKRIFVKYKEDDWQMITIITDRIIYNYYADFYYSKIKEGKSTNAKISTTWSDLIVSPKTDNTTIKVNIFLETHQFGRCKLRLYKYSSSGNIRLTKITQSKQQLRYDFQTKSYISNIVIPTEISLTNDNNLSQSNDAVFDVIFWNFIHDSSGWGAFQLEFQTEQGFDGEVMIDAQIYESFEYLYPNKERVIIKDEENIYLAEDNLYLKFGYTEDWKRSRWIYHFTRIEEYFFGVDTKVVGCINKWEQTAIIANREYDGILYFMNDRGAIVDTPEWWIMASYVYPWIEFMSFVKKDEFIYILAKDRGVIWLYVWYAGNLKFLFWGEKVEYWDYILGEDKFRFNGLMKVWRGGLILWTDDNQLLIYQENQWQNSLSSFFYEEEVKEIIRINANKDQLYLTYTGNDGKNYHTSLQSDRILKNYQSDFSITFPKQIGSHLLEKEPKELEISYMLPNKNCSLEVWLNVNNYHFRTYDTEGEVQLTNGSYKIDGTDGEYQLKFIEKWENKLTFVLEGELPHQTEKKPLKLIKVDGDWPEEIPAKSFDHFKHIWSIREEQFTHGKQRLIALTAEHNLPRARVLQVRVDWKTDWKSSPEIYSVHFTSEQVQR